MVNLQELTEKRAKLVIDARAMRTKAETEKRTLSADEEKAFDTMLDDAEKVGEEIKREERARKLELELAGKDKANPKGDSPVLDKVEDRNDPKIKAKREFRIWLYNALGVAEHLGPEEKRDLSMGVNVSGGNVIAPEQFVMDIIKSVDDMVFIRQFSTKYTVTSAHDLGIPTLDTNPADADWTSELATGSADTSTAFGKRTWKPYPIAKRVLISNKLLRAAPMDIEAFMRERLAYKFGITQEKAFLTGSGASQPLGVFTASANGISTARDVSTANTTTAMTADGLINAKYSIKGNYWSKLRWIFHRDGMKQISKFKDGEGSYLWRTALVAGDPDMLLGFPLHMSEYAPNTFTTGLYVGLLGDFSQYYVADALDMTVQRLTELYAESNKTGLIGRMETDAMPVLEEAFARVTLA